ncbi:MAG: hypothetical protein CMG46_04165, partial [Candidatus Marinimicrobia bacterium]|nr:hypothetical protein [Candidatus Neomarinimicrobiota bacterium]
MKHQTFNKKWIGFAAVAACAALGLNSIGLTAYADDLSPQIESGKIGYALTDARWAILQTENGKTECPDGFNQGPRKQFNSLFPNGGSVKDTRLERESVARYPQDKKDNFPYHRATGKYAIGLNLDGKIGADDFTSETGEAGVDNQLFRAIGCTRLFRAPDGTYAHFTNMWVREMNFNRILIELTGVDSLENDEFVDVAMYRGRDRLITDATGANIIPGGSNRVDERYGAEFIHHLKGKITNGVLTTEPADVRWPWAVFLERPGFYDIRDLRFSVKLGPEHAEGLVAGYADIETWYAQLVRSWSTHHSSYGGLSQPSLYHQMYQLADGHPDETGAMTALSSAITVKMTQVFIEHSRADVASNQNQGKSRRIALNNT